MNDLSDDQLLDIFDKEKIEQLGPIKQFCYAKYHIPSNGFSIINPHKHFLSQQDVYCKIGITSQIQPLELNTQISSKIILLQQQQPQLLYLKKYDQKEDQAQQIQITEKTQRSNVDQLESQQINQSNKKDSKERKFTDNIGSTGASSQGDSRKPSENIFDNKLFYHQQQQQQQPPEAKKKCQQQQNYISDTDYQSDSTSNVQNKALKFILPLKFDSDQSKMCSSESRLNKDAQVSNQINQQPQKKYEEKKSGQQQSDNEASARKNDDKLESEENQKLIKIEDQYNIKNNQKIYPQQNEEQKENLKNESVKVKGYHKHSDTFPNISQQNQHQLILPQKTPQRQVKQFYQTPSTKSRTQTEYLSSQKNQDESFEDSNNIIDQKYTLPSERTQPNFENSAQSVPFHTEKPIFKLEKEVIQQISQKDRIRDNYHKKSQSGRWEFLKQTITYLEKKLIEPTPEVTNYNYKLVHI